MPSHHSSSSHSSSSRSSSRSSGSSFRSSSSHSSSSRSYSSGSSRSYGSSRSSRSSGPSGHSASSRGSGWAAASRPAPQPTRRPRVNQPVGFLISQSLRPSYYYGRRHDYVYYPQSWTDADTGTYYEKGYYDENGKYYDSVAFQKNGRYENVVCYCPYCDGTTVKNLENTAGAEQSMQCPNCGAPLEIKSELDEITGQAAGNTHVYDSEASLENAFGRKKRRRGRGLAIAIVIAAFMLLSQTVKSALRQSFQPTVQYEPAQNISLIEDGGSEDGAFDYHADTLYLEKQADGSYRVVNDVLRADLILSYDAAEDSLYEANSDCWIWYNDQVSPPVWQYWYEGISSDFGDYGWMEHDHEGWWIEASAGNWIPLPEQYSTEGLWYIQ